VKTLALFAVLLAGCPKGSDNKKTIEPAQKGSDARSSDRLLPLDDSGTVLVLPPAPPLPAVPAGLPMLSANPLVTPDAVALGELLFYDARLATDGKTSCATCHDPAHGYSGTATATAAGKMNLRRAPALVNLAWTRELGWDGRYASLDEQLPVHVRGQLGDDLDPALAKIADLPLYKAQLSRLATAGNAARDTVALRALEAYVLTRYDGDSAWDKLEPTARTPTGSGSAAVNPIVAGYLVFTGKGQCAVCHTPPLYTDLGYHKTFTGAIADPGRGKVDPKLDGAFRTPTIRGAAARTAFFHDGSKKTLDEVLDAYTANPELKIALTPQDRTNLVAFLKALASTTPPPQKPVLP
jgi:cytochrome c peroxidase